MNMHWKHARRLYIASGMAGAVFVAVLTQMLAYGLAGASPTQSSTGLAWQASGLMDQKEIAKFATTYISIPAPSSAVIVLVTPEQMEALKRGYPPAWIHEKQTVVFYGPKGDQDPSCEVTGQ